MPGTVLLLAASPVGKGCLVDAASVLPVLAAVSPQVLSGADTANVVELADPLEPQAVLTRLRAAAAAPGPLTVFLTGQLSLDRRQHLPHLALARTTPASVRYTALPWHWIAEELRLRAPGTTAVVADLHADPAAWQHLLAHPLSAGPTADLYGRVAPPPPRRTVASPTYMKAVATLLRSGHRPPLPQLHEHALARVTGEGGHGDMILHRPAQTPGTAPKPPPPPTTPPTPDGSVPATTTPPTPGRYVPSAAALPVPEGPVPSATAPLTPGGSVPSAADLPIPEGFVLSAPAAQVPEGSVPSAAALPAPEGFVPAAPAPPVPGDLASAPALPVPRGFAPSVSAPPVPGGFVPSVPAPPAPAGSAPTPPLPEGFAPGPPRPAERPRPQLPPEGVRPDGAESGDPHALIAEAVRAGRHVDADGLAAREERDAVRAHGPGSEQALHWMEVRADLAMFAGDAVRSCRTWLAIATARLGAGQLPEEPAVETAADRAHHQWGTIDDPARARELGPAVADLRRRVPGRREGALSHVQRHLDDLQATELTG
ncbi:hypothetical protein ACFVGN_04415 [Streptomyces sp. NPDC057757]|uniref:hypothetical protein n=1 Tax=Streptomyces sp. NPDC057757 TaxID=3346241 RepID=UPI0036B70C6C